MLNSCTNMHFIKSIYNLLRRKNTQHLAKLFYKVIKIFLWIFKKYECIYKKYFVGSGPETTYFGRN